MLRRAASRRLRGAQLEIDLLDRAADGVARKSLAHPGRSYGTTALDIPATFASVECQNGTEGSLQNENAAAIARRCALPGIGGSDAHSVREVGVCATRFRGAVHHELTFIQALRSGAYAAERVAAST